MVHRPLFQLGEYGIDAILDMGRTVTHVMGDMVRTILVAKSEGALDLAVWDRKE